ncbi:hypothetical protein LCGC14_0628270 [marine sediment metagenome]|uniref:Uncharacterized protein n=1 Tax=marine sediment metagenome TaxID=412755 RepID=A0A0F9UB78_9ZZZZ
MINRDHSEFIIDTVRKRVDQFIKSAVKGKLIFFIIMTAIQNSVKSTIL